MLRADRRQANNSHSVSLRSGWSEVIPAINRDLVPHRRQTSADLFVVALNAAIFRNYSSAPDECDFQFLIRACRKSETNRGGLPLFIAQALVEADKLLIVCLGGIAVPHEFPACRTHGVGHSRQRTQKADG